MKLLGLILICAAALGVPRLQPRPAFDVQVKLFMALERGENCRAWKNPGCLKYARQFGARLGPHGYAIFHTLRDGEMALIDRIKRSAGQTVDAFCRGYNPGRPKYLHYIASLAGLDLRDRL